MENNMVDIPGYEGKYGATRTGEVYSYNYGRQGILKKLKLFVNSEGYQFTCLFMNGKQKNLAVHRIVALSFIPNEKNKPEVNHKDCNRLNNNVENLEWSTRKENVLHAYNLGLYRKGSKHPGSKINEDIAYKIKHLLHQGYSNSRIKKALGISIKIIQQIALDKNWKHVIYPSDKGE